MICSECGIDFNGSDEVSASFGMCLDCLMLNSVPVSGLDFPADDSNEPVRFCDCCGSEFPDDWDLETCPSCEMRNEKPVYWSEDFA